MIKLNTKARIALSQIDLLASVMTSILRLTEQLRPSVSQSTEENHGHLKTVYSRRNHLLNLINDIIELSMIEYGRFETEIKAHCLSVG